jgi:formate dehydrogenase major subunit
VGIAARLRKWPVYRQLTGADPLARGPATRSAATDALRPRTETADKVVPSICPYCGVGCAQSVYVRGGRVVQIEGDPDSTVSRGRLCPKGSASLQLTTGPGRRYEVLYRRPYGADWERLELGTAMNMVADRVVKTRRDTWEWGRGGARTRRTLGIASLGGATLDNEENYLIRKLFTALGMVQVENQARGCHGSTAAALGSSFGRGGSTTYLQDLQNSDCVIIEGSNFAEGHPVGFQWVMEAKARGATIIHVDPRFSRTSAMADLFVPIRAGTDIAFLGGLIHRVLETDAYFREYVVNYTNAATIVEDAFRDTEELAGLFSGLRPGHRDYETEGWGYRAPDGGPQRDETLRDPRCVFQILRRHYARYTPEMVERTCGIPRALFERVCGALVANSGRERTTAFAYAVGWTQHTVGVQYIRAASVLQLLLGNIGRPGGGIMALRGHAGIQGSSDVLTPFDVLPGYLPMPHAHAQGGLERYLAANAAAKGYWANLGAYTVSLLKSYFGDAATVDNDWCFDYLPRVTGGHGTDDTAPAQRDGACRGYFLLGENPAVGSANSRLRRLGMARLDWLVVRDVNLVESATWWRDGPEVESGELSTKDIGTEVFFFPAAAHTEKAGSFTNTNRMLQWHEEAVEPAGDARSDLWFMYHLGNLIRSRLAGSTDPMDRPVLDLTWDYPVHGRHDEPDAVAVLAEINGRDATGGPLSGYDALRDDGSTACGCWIYCGVYKDGVNQSARRRSWRAQNWVGGEWGWAWPANRRTLYNRASADPHGRPWSERKALVWWDPDDRHWHGHDVPDFPETRPPDYRPRPGASGVAALSGVDPFIMQSDGKGWLYAPAGLVDGPLPTHYEPEESPFPNELYPDHPRNPVRRTAARDPDNLYHPSGSEPGADVFPYVLTTCRLTEHFTAGGMSRWLPYLAELQPEFFCEVSPALAAERDLTHLGWATIVTARNAIEARVIVTDRMPPLRVQGRTLHQIGLPAHWGPNGYTTGDAANELSPVVLDPNAHLQEARAWTVDIRPGRRPRGPDRLRLVEEYRRRAGINEHTGTEI